MQEHGEELQLKLQPCSPAEHQQQQAAEEKEEKGEEQHQPDTRVQQMVGEKYVRQRHQRNERQQQGHYEQQQQSEQQHEKLQRVLMDNEEEKRLQRDKKQQQQQQHTNGAERQQQCVEGKGLPQQEENELRQHLQQDNHVLLPQQQRGGSEGQQQEDQKPQKLQGGDEQVQAHEVGEELLQLEQQQEEGQQQYEAPAARQHVKQCKKEAQQQQMHVSSGKAREQKRETKNEVQQGVGTRQQQQSSLPVGQEQEEEGKAKQQQATRGRRQQRRCLRGLLRHHVSSRQQQKQQDSWNHEDARKKEDAQQQQQHGGSGGQEQQLRKVAGTTPHASQSPEAGTRQWQQQNGRGKESWQQPQQSREFSEEQQQEEGQQQKLQQQQGRRQPTRKVFSFTEEEKRGSAGEAQGEIDSQYLEQQTQELVEQQRRFDILVKRLHRQQEDTHHQVPATGGSSGGTSALRFAPLVPTSSSFFSLASPAAGAPQRQAGSACEKQQEQTAAAPPVPEQPQQRQEEESRAKDRGASRSTARFLVGRQQEHAWGTDTLHQWLRAQPQQQQQQHRQGDFSRAYTSQERPQDACSLLQFNVERSENPWNAAASAAECGSGPSAGAASSASAVQRGAVSSAEAEDSALWGEASLLIRQLHALQEQQQLLRRQLIPPLQSLTQEEQSLQPTQPRQQHRQEKKEEPQRQGQKGQQAEKQETQQQVLEDFWLQEQRDSTASQSPQQKRMHRKQLEDQLRQHLRLQRLNRQQQRLAGEGRAAAREMQKKVLHGTGAVQQQLHAMLAAKPPQRLFDSTFSQEPEAEEAAAPPEALPPQGSGTEQEEVNKSASFICSSSTPVTTAARDSSLRRTAADAAAAPAAREKPALAATCSSDSSSNSHCSSSSPPLSKSCSNGRSSSSSSRFPRMTGSAPRVTLHVKSLQVCWRGSFGLLTAAGAAPPDFPSEQQGQQGSAVEEATRRSLSRTRGDPGSTSRRQEKDHCSSNSSSRAFIGSRRTGVGRRRSSCSGTSVSNRGERSASQSCDSRSDGESRGGSRERSGSTSVRTGRQQRKRQHEGSSIEEPSRPSFSRQSATVCYCLVVKYKERSPAAAAAQKGTEPQQAEDQQLQQQQQQDMPTLLPLYTTAWYEASSVISETRAAAAPAAEQHTAAAAGGRRSCVVKEACPFNTEVILPELSVSQLQQVDSNLLLVQIWRQTLPTTSSRSQSTSSPSSAGAAAASHAPQRGANRRGKGTRHKRRSSGVKTPRMQRRRGSGSSSNQNSRKLSRSSARSSSGGRDGSNKDDRGSSRSWGNTRRLALMKQKAGGIAAAHGEVGDTCGSGSRRGRRGESVERRHSTSCEDEVAHGVQNVGEILLDLNDPCAYDRCCSVFPINFQQQQQEPVASPPAAAAAPPTFGTSLSPATAVAGAVDAAAEAGFAAAAEAKERSKRMLAGSGRAAKVSEAVQQQHQQQRLQGGKPAVVPLLACNARGASGTLYAYVVSTALLPGPSVPAFGAAAPDAAAAGRAVATRGAAATAAEEAARPGALAEDGAAAGGHRKEKERDLKAKEERDGYIEQQWHYVDDAGVLQGPYDSTQMLRWIRRGYFEDDASLSNAAAPHKLQPLRVLLPQLRGDAAAAAAAAAANACVQSSHSSDKTIALDIPVSVSTTATREPEMKVSTAEKPHTQLHCIAGEGDSSLNSSSSPPSANSNDAQARSSSRSGCSDIDSAVSTADYEPAAAACAIADRRVPHLNASVPHVSFCRTAAATPLHEPQEKLTHADEAPAAAAAGEEATNHQAASPSSFSLSPTRLKTLARVVAVAAAPVALPAAGAPAVVAASLARCASHAASSPSAASLTAASPASPPASPVAAAASAAASSPAPAAASHCAAASPVKGGVSALPSAVATSVVQARDVQQSPADAATSTSAASPSSSAGVAATYCRLEGAGTSSTAAAATSSSTAASSSGAASGVVCASAGEGKFLDVLTSLRQAEACLSRVSTRRMSEYLRYTVAAPYAVTAASTPPRNVHAQTPQTESPFPTPSGTVPAHTSVTPAATAAWIARSTRTAPPAAAPVAGAYAANVSSPQAQLDSLQCLAHNSRRGSNGELCPRELLLAHPSAQWRSSSHLHDEEKLTASPSAPLRLVRSPKCSCCASYCCGYRERNSPATRSINNTQAEHSKAACMGSREPINKTTTCTKTCRELQRSHCVQQRTRVLEQQFGVSALRDACATYIQAAARGWLTRVRLEKAICMLKQQQVYRPEGAATVTAASREITLQQHRTPQWLLPASHNWSSRKQRDARAAQGESTFATAAGTVCPPRDTCPAAFCGSPLSNPGCRRNLFTFHQGNSSRVALPIRNSSSRRSSDCSNTECCSTGCCCFGTGMPCCANGSSPSSGGVRYQSILGFGCQGSCSPRNRSGVYKSHSSSGNGDKFRPADYRSLKLPSGRPLQCLPEYDPARNDHNVCGSLPAFSVSSPFLFSAPRIHLRSEPLSGPQPVASHHNLHPWRTDVCMKTADTPASSPPRELSTASSVQRSLLCAAATSANAVATSGAAPTPRATAAVPGAALAAFGAGTDLFSSAAASGVIAADAAVSPFAAASGGAYCGTPGSLCAPYQVESAESLPVFPSLLPRFS